jgi:hypothetical protein
MTANDISRIGTPSLFQGKAFTNTPERSFGWITFPTETKRSPGFSTDDYTGREVSRYQEVQIYSTTEIDGIEWYMIGPDQWIPEKQDWQRLIGRVIPNTTPPEGVDNGRWIEVNLKDQTISIYDQNELVFATLIASGIEPFWTRPGLFQIYQKLDSTPMRGAFEADRSDAYYLEDVPWTMYYDKPGHCMERIGTTVSVHRGPMGVSTCLLVMRVGYMIGLVKEIGFTSGTHLVKPRQIQSSMVTGELRDYGRTSEKKMYQIGIN